MRNVNARFSYERRVKLTVICIMCIIGAFLILPAPSAFRAYSEEYTEPAGKINLIRTNNSTDNFSIFECSGKKITARGCYTPDRIRKLYIEKYEDSSGTYSMRSSEDGSYEAELSLTPEEGQHRLTVRLNSGAVMRYLIYYNAADGWFFPQNGLEEKNRSVFGHIYDAPAEAAALYLSPTADEAEISSALEQIQLISDTITKDAVSEYEKARAISSFIAGSVYYDHDARETNADGATIALCNVLKTKKTVCAGFANLFCALAEAAGIDAVNIKGGVTATDGDRPVSYDQLTDGLQNHEFAAFYSTEQERWVWVDACWDGSYKYKDGEYIDGKTKEMYFDISDEALSLNHRADKAERRKYFSAKTETSPLGADVTEAGEPLPEITSQSAVTEPPVSVEPLITASDTEAVTDAPDNGKNDAPEEDDTVLLIIIAVLAVCVAAAAVITIKTIVNGRKER